MVTLSLRITLLIAAVAACPLPAFSFAPASAGIRMDQRSNNRVLGNFFAVSQSELQNEGTTPTAADEGKPQHRRRERYSGRYPRNFKDKYKERSGDEETIQKVLAKGITPAGTHVPIMVKECLKYMGLDERTEDDESSVEQQQQLLVVDCTLGYGGHSSYILKHLLDVNTNNGIMDNNNGISRLIAFDQDSVEIKKTEERLRSALNEKLLLEQSTRDINNQPSRDDDGTNDDLLFTTVNQNFQTLGTYLSTTNQTGRVTSLLADLGLSSMQIDDNDRGFTYKRSGPLDMRMNPSDDNDDDDGANNTETAYNLLQRLKVRKLKSMLKENSDEEFAADIAAGLIGKGMKIPETTIELADRVRDIVRPLIEKQNSSRNNGRKAMSKYEVKKMKKQLDSTVARVMQAIRIEVNGEFEALDKLLEDVPKVLSPGGKAVFLTFHSGEDRRVKKSFKNGFKSGIYSAWSRDVVRPSNEERRDNPRSSCCKLRWVIRS